MNKYPFIFLVIMFFSQPVIAADDALISSYEKFFSPYSGKATGKSLQMVSPEAFNKAVDGKKNWFVLDVRTPNETRVYGITAFDGMTVPMNEVFKKENIEKLPENRKIVVVCSTGLRANSIATALRHSGYTDTFILRGGTNALVNYLKPKTVY